MTEKMKPSGIAWIGDIPTEWDLTKIRFATKVRSEKGYYCTEDKYIGLENISSYTGKYIPAETEYDPGLYDVYRKGDVLFSKLRPYLAKALIADDTGFCTGELEVISDYQGDKRFLFYYLLSDGFLKMVDASTYGTKMPRANWEYIKNLQIPVVPYSEQCAIADHLDDQCAKIDSVIADIEKQIETLQKYKKSLITEAVTKGLDRSVPMKDSGIEWVGKIPAHWKVQPLKYLTDIISKGATPDDISGESDSRYTIRFIKAENIQDNKLQKSPEFYIDRHTNNQLQRSFLQENDVLFVIAGATIGKVALVKKQFLPSNINQAVCFLRFNKQYICNAEFFCYVLQSQIITEVIQLYTVQAAQPNLSMGNIANISVPVPAQSEMLAITEYLDKKLLAVEEIIADKKEELLTIQRHKKSLIYEYVTGKKRVTEVN